MTKLLEMIEEREVDGISIPATSPSHFNPLEVYIDEKELNPHEMDQIPLIKEHEIYLRLYSKFCSSKEDYNYAKIHAIKRMQGVLFSDAILIMNRLRSAYYAGDREAVESCFRDFFNTYG